jgi:sodium-dependent dicarboxylate transporter 2/3/5
LGSLIGTPPNAIFAAHVRETYGTEVGFAEWAAVGLPVALLLLVIAWALLARVSPGVETRALELDLGADMGEMGPAERRVALVAGITALGWLSRPLLEWLFPAVPLSDAGIGILAGISLFLLPDGQDGRLLDWKSASDLRWDVLLLFGGGLALAGILQDTGLARSLGGLVQETAHLPELLLLFLIAALIVYVGELASNTAMAAIFLPIAGAVALSLDADPVTFLFPITLAASIGFMLPVATPPNAIVFADPAVTRRDMLHAGAPLDVIGLVITVGAGYLLTPVLF